MLTLLMFKSRHAAEENNESEFVGKYETLGCDKRMQMSQKWHWQKKFHIKETFGIVSWC